MNASMIKILGSTCLALLIAVLFTNCQTSQISQLESNGSHQHVAKVGKLSLKDREWLADKIWQNESSGSYLGLTSWNHGEQFPSLGIGHMIWYPVNYQGAFDESFPQWIKWMQNYHKELLPTWLNRYPVPPCPWTSKASFDNSQNNRMMKELRKFLLDTKIEQVDFIILRSQKSRAKLAQEVEPRHRAHILSNYDKLTQSPQGQYALIDYVNFKGEGLKLSERYQGQGWGLYQVLLEMPKNTSVSQASSAFSLAAKKVLTRRVHLSPPSRGEKRWLEGWMNRCSTYR